MRLRDDEGPIRRIAMTGLGRERPTLLISNHFEETPRELIIRYAGRNRIEDGLGISVNSFHLDRLNNESLPDRLATIDIAENQKTENLVRFCIVS